MKANEKLYVAYGSNLNLEQMRHRCPTAKLYGTGEIKDYELQFKGMPHGAYATIAPKEGASVPVAVWTIGPMDERRLDSYEGYPSHYFKQNVPVELGDKSVEAMVYIMNLRMSFGLPSPGYYRVVSDGYRDCNLDVRALNDALAKSTLTFYQRMVPSYTLDDDPCMDDPDEDEEESFGMELQ